MINNNKLNSINTLILLLTLLGSLAKAQTFVNPFAELPDPYITYIDGYYYYMGTGATNVVIKRSTTLEGLKHVPNTIIYTPSGTEGIPNYPPVWAQEIIELDGNYYLYYTASLDAGSNVSSQRIFVLENTTGDLMNPIDWVFKGRLFDADADYYAIDGTVFELNGQRYFVWSGIDAASAAFNLTGPQHTFIAQMQNPWTLQGSRVKLTDSFGIPSPFGGNAADGFINEGQIFIQRNGKVFMVYSAHGCNSPNYQLRMIYMNESDDPMDPNSWQIYPDVMLESNAANFAFGPGHLSFFKSPDGTEDWFAYHATPIEQGECSSTRTARAQKLNWNNAGFPEFGTPGASGALNTAPSGEPVLPTSGIIQNGLYYLICKASDKAVAVAEASPFSGANVHQWESGANLWQQWRIQATQNGFFTITSAHNGYVLEGEPLNQNESANVRVSISNGKDKQLWSLEAVDDTCFKIVNKASGAVLEVEPSSISDNGANLRQNSWSGNENQLFQFEETTGALSVEEQHQVLDKNVQLYPNPASTHFSISGNQPVVQIELQDMAGRRLKQNSISSIERTVEISNLKPGLYVVTLFFESGIVLTKKLRVK